jgi:hypothetical protein
MRLSSEGEVLRDSLEVSFLFFLNSLITSSCYREWRMGNRE